MVRVLRYRSRLGPDDRGTSLVAELPPLMIVAIAFVLFFASVPIAFAQYRERDTVRALLAEADDLAAALVTDPAFLVRGASAPGLFDIEKVAGYQGHEGWTLLDADLARTHHSRIQLLDVSSYPKSSSGPVLSIQSWPDAEPEPAGLRASASSPVALVEHEGRVYASRLVVTIWGARL